VTTSLFSKTGNVGTT